MQHKIEIVQTLLEALPYIKKFRDEIIVIKYGGSAQESEELKAKFAQDIVLLHTVGMRPVVVHGGGKNITRLLSDLGVDTRFIDGQRVTTREVMRVAEMVLSGEINKEIVALLNSQGARAVGISGKDANFLEAIPKDSENFGYTGVIEQINTEIVDNILDDGFVPVIAPIAGSQTLGHPGFNINADLAASRIAVALGARKILFLTDTPGVLDGEGKLIPTLTIDQTRRLKEEEVIRGGMIPKVDACIDALRGGVKKAHIIDGRVEHSLLLEILTSSGIGTCIEL
ncbi:acetylglutamate kinase [Nitratifractor salsuginis]|uniref:Acetylglutamate kinase n=1 Tax=Nitratifractor salsuginis (strain DSM 16511 / JCM 12458 / E9I37-1) TaxID=749222 RepID=E6X078_NITSE|nr:acetylglutamate kinase [Nitratifractor salsuginis]ADV45667.1 N-acetylglutamate kinase [Nitratifractor salsuginis DSM 16511]